MSSSIPGPGPAEGERASIGTILSDITTDVSTLMRQEVALAKAEAKQSAVQAGKGAGMYAGAGVSAHFVLLFLSIAGWWALGDGIGRGWAALIVALVWAVIAAVLYLRGKAEMKRVSSLTRTTETVKQIPDAMQPHPENAPVNTGVPQNPPINTGVPQSANAYNVNEERA